MEGGKSEIIALHENTWVSIRAYNEHDNQIFISMILLSLCYLITNRVITIKKLPRCEVYVPFHPLTYISNAMLTFS